MLYKAIYLLTGFFIFHSSLAYAQDSSTLITNENTSFTFTSDVYANVSGGLETGVRYLDNIDVEVAFDALGFSFFIYGLGNQGKSISEIVGDSQTLSNIDTENSWRFFELWIERSMPTINSSILLGLYDLNSEFDAINTGGLFINSSHGIGPDFSSSGITGPSIFPLSSLAARVKINPIKGVSLKIAVLDAVPSDPFNTRGTSVFLRKNEGALLISELSFSKFGEQSESLLSRGINEETPFRLVLGAWKYTEERLGWLGEMESDHGVYAIGEVSLQNGLSFYTRLGAVNRDINRYNYYVGAGLSIQNLIETRPDDILGLAFALPINSDDFVLSEDRNGNDFTNNETNIELTYLMVISDQLSFQFDTQYIQHPNQAPNIDDAFVFGIRSVIAF